MAYTGKNHPPGNKLSPKRIAELERAAAATELRKRGKNFQEIAEICGYANRNGAYLAIQRSLAKAIREPSEEVIELELTRLDSMLDGLWDQAIGTPSYIATEPTYFDGQLLPPGTRVPAVQGSEKVVNAILKLMERRAKLLGLDKPTEKKVDFTVTEVPSAPVDMADYNVKLLAALQIAGALHLELPAHLQGLESERGLVLEGEYEEVDDAVHQEV